MKRKLEALVARYSQRQQLEDICSTDIMMSQMITPAGYQHHLHQQPLSQEHPPPILLLQKNRRQLNATPNSSLPESPPLPPQHAPLDISETFYNFIGSANRVKISELKSSLPTKIQNGTLKKHSPRLNIPLKIDEASLFIGGIAASAAPVTPENTAAAAQNSKQTCNQLSLTKLQRAILSIKQIQQKQLKPSNRTLSISNPIRYSPPPLGIRVQTPLNSQSRSLAKNSNSSDSSDLNKFSLNARSCTAKFSKLFYQSCERPLSSSREMNQINVIPTNQNRRQLNLLTDRGNSTRDQSFSYLRSSIDSAEITYSNSARLPNSARSTIHKQQQIPQSSIIVKSSPQSTIRRGGGAVPVKDQTRRDPMSNSPVRSGNNRINELAQGLLSSPETNYAKRAHSFYSYSDRRERVTQPIVMLATTQNQPSSQRYQSFQSSNLDGFNYIQQPQNNNGFEASTDYGPWVMLTPAENNDIVWS